MNLENIKNMVEELDYELGLEYCGGDEEFYAEMLEEYASNGRFEKLQELYDIMDVENYKIEVHALKSTSRMIGLTDLGDLCEELQKASEVNDTEFILANHGDMMNAYSNYIEIIRSEM